ncbi:MAG TPA: pyridoxal phosphate-dependent aminotransferase [Candidatus Faecousia faecigallinarum]|nr:pyridoxal phosphate-dependent aminotransferase [Candidatus Faecousia faecigallinarum]
MVSKEMWALGANRSVIRDLFEYGLRQAAVVGPENVFDYSLGNPSIPSPPQVNDAVRAILADTDSVTVHGYTPAIGDFATRKAIADDLNQRYAAGVRPENLFICCGAAPGLIAVFRALAATPQAEFIAIAPYFPEYKPFVDCAGGKLTVVPADTEHFQINLDALAERITPNTQAVIVNSPNNPAGTVYTAETLTALGKLLDSRAAQYGHPIYILADEPYRELVYGGVEVPFIPNLYRNTIVCYSYSKSLSLPGERIGYLYVPDGAQDSAELYAAIAGAARAGGHVCAPSLWQKVIARCAGLRPDLAAYDRNRRTLQSALTAMGYRMASPDGAFYLFIQAPGGDDVAFSEKAKAKNLLVVPGTGFGCPGWFRICYCVSPEMIQRSLPAFQALIGK